MRKHKHLAIFHKAGNRNMGKLPLPAIGRRAHGLLTNVRPLTPNQRQKLAKRAHLYLGSSPAHRWGGMAK